MIIFFSIIIVVLIPVIIYVLSKIFKEEKEIFAEEKRIQAEEEAQNPKIENFATVINNENFEQLLEEAKNDFTKMEILKRNIQENLRTATKNKNMDQARTCNMQLKRISEVEKGINS